MFSEVMVKEGFAAKYTCGAASTCRARFQPQSVRLARPTPARGGAARTSRRCPHRTRRPAVTLAALIHTSACREATSNGDGPSYQGRDPESDWYVDRDKDGVVWE